ncbi:MAG: tRNA pseudouridine(13) synthase TruD [Candidatus Aenigmarchaeota archaeon]|nr:tRNA pseudouridine(13) synthase TruD [Candidatus Aenigmarchaeota archaeon]
MAWQLKGQAGDFMVYEILDDVTEQRWKEKLSRIRGDGSKRERGRYLWMTMRKHDLDFFRAIDMLAKSLGISTRSISYSGTKDKRAVTSQTISVFGIDEKDAGKIAINGMELSGFRFRHRHVRLGEHSGNRFRITVRNVEPDEMDWVKRSLGDMKREGMVNYFGEQRFGSCRHVDDEVGKHIILGEFKEAVMSFLTVTSDSEPAATREARRNLMRTGDLAAASREFPVSLGHEHAMISHLARRPDDCIGALRRLPLRLLKLFVHAYQSMIWNKAAGAVLAEGRGQACIPIPGYKTRLGRYGKLKGVLERVMKDEGIKTGMFRVGAFPRLSSAGSERNLLVHPANLSCSIEDDDLNKGMKKLLLSFGLPSGSYATELVRQIQTNADGRFADGL